MADMPESLPDGFAPHSRHSPRNQFVASVLNDGREVIGREASGGFLPLFMTIGKLNSSNGYCAVIRDITQWKRTESELREAKEVAGQFPAEVQPTRSQSRTCAASRLPSWSR